MTQIVKLKYKPAKTNKTKQHKKQHPTPRTKPKQDPFTKEQSEWKRVWVNYLKSNTWHHVRSCVFERDNFTCQFCKEDKLPLHAHHTTYRNVEKLNGLPRPGTEPLEDIITLCERCHAQQHDKQYNKLPPAKVKQCGKCQFWITEDDSNGTCHASPPQLPASMTITLHQTTATQGEKCPAFSFKHPKNKLFTPRQPAGY